MSNTRIVSRKTQRQEKSKKNSINYKCQSTLLPSEFQTIELAAAIICCRRVLFAIASIYGLPLHLPNSSHLTYQWHARFSSTKSKRQQTYHFSFAKNRIFQIPHKY